MLNIDIQRLRQFGIFSKQKCVLRALYKAGILRDLSLCYALAGDRAYCVKTRLSLKCQFQVLQV